MALFSAMLVQCQTPADKAEQTKAELRTNWDAFIQNWEDQNAEACVNIFTKDGLSVPPKSEPLQGRSAIASLYHRLFKENISSRYKHEIISVRQSGDMAIERGRFTVYWISKDSTAWSYEGRSLTHWSKTENNTWKIEHFMFNNPPGPNDR